ncbi:dihydrofolate reductase [Bacteroidia bacterium]|nr:dihydrofolate reductase [Bacteroidia bacterium]
MTQLSTPFSILVAIAQNNAIGLNNTLLWHITEDLKRFKQLTLDHTIIMGLKTFYSLPVRPLPRRRTIVLADDHNLHIEGCEMAYSINDVLRLADPHQENFICGGGSIYRQFINVVDTIHLTMVYKDFEADTFFPDIDKSVFALDSESPLSTDEASGLTYQFQTFRRTHA